MSELRKPYIKLWAAETLLSDDMASLTDHEERVFWRLMMVASLEEERWITRETPGLHRKCVTTAQKFARAIAKLEAFGMVKRLDDGRLLVVNGKKWNEDTDRTRYPSDSPERVKERVGRFRNGKRNEDVTSGNDSLQNAVTTPYRKEKEKEKEKEQEPTAAVLEDEPSKKERQVGNLIRSWENATATTVTRTLGDHLADWLERLPEAAIVKAIAETGASNARNWRYCEAILRRYETEGWADKPKGRVITFDDDLPLPEGMALPEVRFQR